MSLVVIMAGGRGQRLHPLTAHVPKPMLHAGPKPILETVVEGFREYGFTRIVLAVNYRRQVIEDHFGDGSKFGVEISYLRESEALGTAGALGLLPPQNEPVIVQNGDVIARLDYRKLLAEHKSHDALATMCLAVYQHQVPYGVVDMDACFVSGTREKPIESWMVNAGLYVLSPKLLATIRGRCDMPDVLANAEGFVRCHQIDDFWIDVGRFEDLARANGA